jgi:ankyrin repeat protein
MKYLRLFEDFDSYDPYELMIIPPNKKAEMIIGEIYKDEPNLNLVSDLITLGANVDWQDEDNYNYTPLHLAVREESVEIARMLIDSGADLNLQDQWGYTPLHWAAIKGNEEIARMLIDAKADLDVQDNDGRTPLHRAASDGSVEIARMLIDAGSRKDIRDEDGRIPYDFAQTRELKILLKP